SRFERADPTQLDSSIASAFTHLLFTPNDRDEARVIGWVEHASSPYVNRLAFAQPAASEGSNAVHGQVAWEHRTTTQAVWTLFGRVARRRPSNGLVPASGLGYEP